MWDVVWDQFSRSVRNISDNNWIYQLFGAFIEAAPPKGVAPHSLSYTALHRSLSERALGQSVSAIVSKGRTPDKGRHPQ